MKYSNIMNQILQLIPRYEFERIVKSREAEKHSKGFKCWDQFVAMAFLQLSKSGSLTEICQGLSTCAGKLVHLGLNKAPGKSTLAYANKERPWEVYEDLFYVLLEKFKKKMTNKKTKFKFKNKLCSFDASTIDLCQSMFEWALFRKRKGAVKLHMVLDHGDYMPTFCNITDGKTHEVKVLKSLCFEPGTIVAFDRGCIDYELFDEWTENGVYFVTREKDGMNYGVTERRRHLEGGTILRDELIVLTGFHASKKCDATLRRIEVWNEEKKEKLIFITNNLKLASKTIAAIYKDRWMIEIFFKTIKQHLKIKTFVGTSANALKTQIWTALICVLIVKYLKFISKADISLSNLVALLRLNLLIYKDLYAWLDDPLGTPQIEPGDYIQLELFGQHNSRPGFQNA